VPTARVPDLGSSAGLARLPSAASLVEIRLLQVIGRYYPEPLYVSRRLAALSTFTESAQEVRFRGRASLLPLLPLPSSISSLISLHQHSSAMTQVGEKEFVRLLGQADGYVAL